MKSNSTYSRLPMPATVVGAVLFALLFLAGCATPVGKVASWPITNAEENQFSGEVVDVLCELGGNCADNCGEGTRQLAIKTPANGTVLVAKNLNNFTGAADELWQFCGQVVDVNGLFTENRGVRFFQAQNVRPTGGQWQKTTQYLQAWSARSGKSLGVAPKWYLHDERVKDVLARDGRLGLGVEADEEYFN